MKLTWALTEIQIALANSRGIANYWFSFGDSYTSTGFVSDGIQPSPESPLGNPPFPGMTTTGGTNWIDQCTVKYNKSLVLTYNYAYPGATIDNALVNTGAKSMTDQVNEFLGSIGSSQSVPWTGENTLFSFWIGINDIGNTYSEPGSRDAFSDTLLWAYFNLVEKNAGARNFLFINVPPVNRSPMMMSNGAAERAQEAAVIAGYNAKLARRVQWLLGNNTAVKTWLWDSHTAFAAILNDPRAYGFVDNTTFGQPNAFWGDNYHPSSTAHELCAQNIANILNATIW
ncbi:carbohydrate esterase family 16 protein [Phanerochaete sordida]|uniref:Carbohydrate esterase family 16 protein n=1 Tax=Phanerochaete sordida TaxID=48140 RepID=A0A9P3GGV2_9APHY|nr:carbohydrate esterase family 16 protein [Phanerochaete sordida]